MKMVVAKFGGTSMADALAMENSARIVSNDESRRLIVVSATSQTTNTLLKLADLAMACDIEAVEELLDSVLNRHLTLADEVSAEAHVKQMIEEIVLEAHVVLNLMSKSAGTFDKTYKQMLDRLLSCGERMSSQIFAALLRSQGKRCVCFDARDVMKTDSTFGKGEVNLDETRDCALKYLIPLLEENEIVITQGFIASNKMGQTTTLGRGGSDYSAALFAEAVRADALEIWTDVAGIYTTDPRVVPEAHVIKEISFAEAAELAAFGAKVLHPATLWPAVRQDISVFVGNSKDPQSGGTWIHREITDRPIIRAIAQRKNQTIVTVTSLNMLNAHGFLAKLFGILAKHRISVDLVTTSEVSVSLTIDGTNCGSSGQSLMTAEVIKELQEFCKVSIEEGLALIALIGNNMHQTHGLNSYTFKGVSQTNIRLLCQGASKHNMCFLVRGKESEETLRTLHATFLEDNDFDRKLRRENIELAPELN